ncbi:ComF family protein [Herbiconiux sp. YIM B11900]|uniref:ComF family protein n=1 Tax=Herbiconiux sp. YIM B11900 TaxID=3404131 RepID=UPI003F86E049
MSLFTRPLIPSPALLAPDHPLGQWLTEAAAVLVPVVCLGCGEVDRAVCRRCGPQLGPPPVRVADLWPHHLEVAVGLDYGGVVATALGALKERGRTDAVAALAPALRAVLAFAIERWSAPGLPPPLLVCAPSDRSAVRRRGYRPVDDLVRAAGFVAGRVPMLTLNRPIADQAGLSAAGRRANLLGAMTAHPRVGGRCVLLVDDVLTTGSTLIEGRRALEEAGATVLGAACLAHRERRFVTPSVTKDDVQVISR